ncbi:ComF family protein [Nocardia sp. NPDC050697]|uniref:ComF family protein n=1 Tax=Nocardia sp. NPDC050697 TaxID=3155158 RepID=UPI0033DD9B7C
MRTLLELILPVECGGCGLPGLPWCPACASALDGPPVRLRPRTDPGVPCWALGPYAGPGRRAVLALKERGRRDLAGPLGYALARGLHRLRAPGRPLLLIPAPGRAAAARRRGGDPVARTAAVAASWLPGCRMAPLLRSRHGTRDSVGLTPAQRRRNLAARVVVRPEVLATLSGTANPQVVLVDDVLTTGATAAESVRVAGRYRIPIHDVLVTCGT